VQAVRLDAVAAKFRQFDRMTNHLLRMLAVILAASLLTLAGSRARAGQPCQLTTIGTATVATVRDGHTLALADGRELRLAAIEVPAHSAGALQNLVAGRPLRLEKLGPDHDRYGRLVAFAFAGDSTDSVQQVLLAQGEARVSARVGDKACADALLATEREARARRRGLWGDPNSAPLPAENRARLMGERGHFALVEGKVLSVRASAGTIYMNFGRRWTKGFSVVIPRRRQRAFAAAGIALKQLAGRRVRVRGWIEQRRGPIIEADAPEQIELAGGGMGQPRETRP
jgi:endonuclease YncB( thermonuclease family)